MVREKMGDEANQNMGTVSLRTLHLEIFSCWHTFLQLSYMSTALVIFSALDFLEVAIRESTHSGALYIQLDGQSEEHCLMAL